MHPSQTEILSETCLVVLTAFYFLSTSHLQLMSFGNFALKIFSVFFIIAFYPRSLKEAEMTENITDVN
jgi:hypothetical protein